MTKERVVSFLLFSISFIALLFSAAIPSNDAEFGSTPRTIPLLVSLIMCMFSSAYAFFHGFSEGKVTIDINAVLRIFFMLIAVILYIVMLETVGYVVCTLFLSFVSSVAFGYRSSFKLFTFSLLLSVGTWLFFTKLFSVYLPTGVIF